MVSYKICWTMLFIITFIFVVSFVWLILIFYFNFNILIRRGLILFYDIWLKIIIIIMEQEKKTLLILKSLINRINKGGFHFSLQLAKWNVIIVVPQPKNQVSDHQSTRLLSLNLCIYVSMMSFPPKNGNL